MRMMAPLSLLALLLTLAACADNHRGGRYGHGYGRGEPPPLSQLMPGGQTMRGGQRGGWR